MNRMIEDAYQAAMPWEDSFYNMRRYQRIMARNIAFCRLPPADAGLWAQARHIARVLVFTEDYCPDSLNAIPPLLAIAEAAPFDLRVLRRDEDLARMQAITGQEHPRIPTFLFYDQAWRELGRFVEKPQAVQQLDDLDAETAMMLRQDRGAYTEWLWEQVFAELRPIAAGQ